MEKWRPVKGYEGLYEVSDWGRIRSVDHVGYGGRIFRGRMLKNSDHPNGYLQVILSKDGHRRCMRVHRIVYEAFVGDIPDGYQINHIDENKQNNRIENLEAVTPLENLRHGTRIERIAQNLAMTSRLCVPVSQYTPSGELIATYWSISEAGRRSMVSRAHISRCCLGGRKTAGGYIWKYAQEG